MEPYRVTYQVSYSDLTIKVLQSLIFVYWSLGGTMFDP